MTWTTAQMRPADGLRSLKWMRDAHWAGSLDVLVDTSNWTRRIGDEWVMVHEVCDDPYPVRGNIATALRDFSKPGRWTFAQVKAVRLNAVGIAEADKLPEGCPFRNMALRHKAAQEGRVFVAQPTEADRLAERLR